MEKNKLFRENSMKKVTSPEHLNDYIKVSSPGIWILLAAIIVLLAGVIVWAVFGEIEPGLHAISFILN